MSCYHCDAKPGKPHMVDCPSDGRDPWAEETQPTAPTPEEDTAPTHATVNLRPHSWCWDQNMRQFVCGDCGALSASFDRPDVCPGNQAATAAPVLLNSAGEASGWREVKSGVWVLDNA